MGGTDEYKDDSHFAEQCILEALFKKLTLAF